MLRVNLIQYPQIFCWARLKKFSLSEDYTFKQDTYGWHGWCSRILSVDRTLLPSQEAVRSQCSPRMFVVSYTCNTKKYISSLNLPHRILNLPINLFYPPIPVLVVTSVNFLSIFPPSLPTSFPFPGGSHLKLSRGAIFTECSHTFILFCLRKTSVNVEKYYWSLRALYCCAFYRETL